MNYLCNMNKTEHDSRGLFHPIDAAMPCHTALNNPFFYNPDNLALAAVRELQSRLPADPAEGKMWGVLVAEHYGELGFIAAYSGQIDGRADAALDGGWKVCPPVVDYLEPDGYFKTHEREITRINHEIEHLEQDKGYLRAKEDLMRLQAAADEEISRRKLTMKEAKAERDRRRATGSIGDGELQEMTRQSQFLKGEVRRAKARFGKLIEGARQAVSPYEDKIGSLRRRRKLLSDHLQAWLFGQFRLLNARGESKPMPDIFRDYYSKNSPALLKGTAGGMLCPSGAGECCEPKLLQYAFSHGMRPLRMATFWWGPAPADRLRRHGNFYPACGGKCKPILAWMLQGLDVAPNPLDGQPDGVLKVVFEDDWLAVIDKPAGMLAVPGKGRKASVTRLLAERWKGKCRPMAVHRLDMATSGLMIVAKDARTRSRLQRDFENRKIEKEYIAVVERELHTALNGKEPVDPELTYMPATGKIRLPLNPDPMDRPRQFVDMAGGKEATTEYRILSAGNGETRLSLSPKTGRTHQLRVHCAAPLGLNAPIKGDTLYGKPSDRLYLHAARIVFRHPATGQLMTFTSDPDF